MTGNAVVQFVASQVRSFVIHRDDVRTKAADIGQENSGFFRAVLHEEAAVPFVIKKQVLHLWICGGLTIAQYADDLTR